MRRRTFLFGTAAALAAGPAFAQDAFPSRPITIVNAFPPGGANDLVTRPIASAMESVLKQPVVVETKAGAGGQVGAQVGGNRQAGRLHPALPQQWHFRLRRGRQAVRPAAQDHA